MNVQVGKLRLQPASLLQLLLPPRSKGQVDLCRAREQLRNLSSPNGLKSEWLTGLCRQGGLLSLGGLKSTLPF